MVSPSSVNLSALRQPQNQYPAAETPMQTQNATANYDRLALSPEPVGDRRFQLEFISRLSHEVRTAATDVQSVRTQVLNGAYRPDPVKIAANMLLKGAEPE